MPVSSVLTTLLILTSSAACCAGGPDDVTVTEYATPAPDCLLCTQILFLDRQEIVTASNRLYFRDDPEAAFRASQLAGLSDAHGVAYSPQNKMYYIADTSNHRLVATTDLTRGEIARTAARLAGVALDRPHDILCDAASGWLYALNPNRVSVFRFKDLGREELELDLSAHLGYTRALSLVDGKLYVVGSSSGKVVAIDDFESRKFQVHTSFEKHGDAPAGSWTTTGLVPNDADFYDGYWYVTSYFCPQYAAGTDCNEKKLIRFKTWRDFETGQWDDLSSRLPKDIVPYYLTPRKDGLYLAAFYHESDGAPGKVFRITAVKK